MSKTEIEPLHDAHELPDGLFRQLIDQSSDITIVLNSCGRLLYVSPAVFSVFGFCPVSLPRADFLQWFHPAERHSLTQVLSAFLEEPRKLCARLRHHQGYWLTCSVLIQNLASESMASLGIAQADEFWYLMSLRPLQPAVSSQPQLVDEVARENEQTKSYFLAIMSHELRTPINAINGFSQLLLRQRRDRLSPEQEDMVQRILKNGKNLLSLINNVLDLSKLEAGRMRLHLEKLNVADLIEGTTQELASLATENNLVLNTEFTLTDPVISNDPLRLRQILVNLLSNAIKFSEGGEVWVVVEEHEETQLRISVQDSGPGIAFDDIPRVFSEFWQMDQLPSEHHQGTGLGLAISQNLAKMMQGEIQVHSQLGQGATFRLVIPRTLNQTSMRM